VAAKVAGAAKVAETKSRGTQSVSRRCTRRMRLV